MIHPRLVSPSLIPFLLGSSLPSSSFGPAPLFLEGLLFLKSPPLCVTQTELSMCYCRLVTVLFVFFLDQPEILKLTAQYLVRPSSREGITQGRNTRKWEVTAAISVDAPHSLPPGRQRFTSLSHTRHISRVQLCTQQKVRLSPGVYVSLPHLHLSLWKWLLNHRTQ